MESSGVHHHATTIDGKSGNECADSDNYGQLDEGTVNETTVTKTACDREWPDQDTHKDIDPEIGASDESCDFSVHLGHLTDN